jgi:hypothetical protein
LDHVILFDEDSLRSTLCSYLSYYHRWRLHLLLGKDSPDSRPVQSIGRIAAFLRSAACIIDTSGSPDLLIHSLKMPVAAEAVRSDAQDNGVCQACSHGNGTSGRNPAFHLLLETFGEVSVGTVGFCAAPRRTKREADSKRFEKRRAVVMTAAACLNTLSSRIFG